MVPNGSPESLKGLNPSLFHSRVVAPHRPARELPVPSRQRLCQGPSRPGGSGRALPPTEPQTHVLSSLSPSAGTGPSLCRGAVPARDSWRVTSLNEAQFAGDGTAPAPSWGSCAGRAAPGPAPKGRVLKVAASPAAPGQGAGGDLGEESRAGLVGVTLGRALAPVPGTLWNGEGWGPHFAKKSREAGRGSRRPSLPFRGKSLSLELALEASPPEARPAPRQSRPSGPAPSPEDVREAHGPQGSAGEVTAPSPPAPATEQSRGDR